MSTIKTEGTQLTVLDTTHTLATITDAGTYLLRLDTSALAIGETLELEIAAQVRSGAVSLLYTTAFGGTQGAPVKDSLAVPLVAGRSLEFTIRQTGGTGRSFPWEIHQI